MLIEKLDKISLEYEIVFIGKVDFTTFKDQDYLVEANMLDGGLAEIIKNRETDEFDLTNDHYIFYNNPISRPYVTIVETLNKCYASEFWYVFQALVNKMTDEGALPGATKYGFKSTLLQTWATLPVTSPHYFITNESAIKCSINNMSGVFTLITSLSDFFASINSLLPIGLGIEIIGGKECLVLEEREYFYDQTNTIIELGEAKNLGISICPDLNYAKIKCGGPNVSYNSNANSGNDDSNINECNTETNFTIPNTTSKLEYDILSKYRTDYEGLLQLAAEASAEDTKDNGLFMVELAKNSGPNPVNYQQILGKLRKKNAPATEYYKGNLFFSPKRCLTRHQSFISSCCLGLVGDTVDFAASTNDQENNETAHNLTPTVWEQEYSGFTIDTTDIYLSPILIDIEVPYPQMMLTMVNAHPTGIISFYYKEKQYTGYIYKMEVKLAGRGSVKYQLLSTANNDFSNLIR